ncbi:hypothetical protein EVAR_36909_1 [Eumeta japonica]|uniref:Uncharacterized protein n=1 Tax=Eumeta variegata TaxID=151549 RepID=A0A4C1X874_EUMVA|nr:hypothetical protein EVAR_36909_1 [Eumeta japonica]
MSSHGNKYDLNAAHRHGTRPARGTHAQPRRHARQWHPPTASGANRVGARRVPLFNYNSIDSVRTLRFNEPRIAGERAARGG